MTDRYRVLAHNTSTASENKIHDDAVAVKLGFAGGLVPGVDVYAYLCHLPAARWGIEWLEHGTMAARFATPVYDGDEVQVEGTEQDNGELELVLRDSSGAVCASGLAALPAAAAAHADAGDGDELLPPGPLLPDPSQRQPASADVLSTIALGEIELGFRADRAPEYLDAIREPLPLFREGGVAHPGWLLRQANYILSANVRLGPWIHVSSSCLHRAAVRDGDRVTTRGRVTQTYERKEHKFVELEVQWLARGEDVDDPPTRLVMRATHTAIYEPRGVASLA